jgi:serine/threonine protein kinase
MRQLLDGARHMHACRIMHRDIKPGNILVAGGEPISVKICDVRLAASITNRPPYEQVGTRRYMALEMLLGKKDYDAMVDMWSLGCVMAELLISEYSVCSACRGGGHGQPSTSAARACLLVCAQNTTKNSGMNGSSTA